MTNRSDPRRLLGAVAIGILLATASLAWWGRDVAVFLLTIIVAPLMAIVWVVFLIWAYPDRKRRRALLTISAVIFVATPATYWIVSLTHDRVAFLFWEAMHPNVVMRFASQDGIVMTWDEWGFAGLENSSYLVSNPADAISDVRSASEWSHRYANGCEVVAVQRMRHGIYLLTTFNCGLE